MKKKTVISYEYLVFYYKAKTCNTITYATHTSLANALKHVHTLVKYGFDVTLRIRQTVDDGIILYTNEKAVYYTQWQYKHKTSLTSYTFIKVPHYTIIRRFYNH